MLLGGPAGLGDSASLGLPLDLGAGRVFDCFNSRDSEGEGFCESAAFFASSDSNSEPFSIDPKFCVASFRASPEETAFSSFGSAGSTPAARSSAVETGLSGLPAVAVDVGSDVEETNTFSLVCGSSILLDTSSRCSDVEDVGRFPFVFACVSVRVPFKASLESSAPSPVIISPLLPTGLTPNVSAICPLLSTATKLVRTLDSGRELSLVTLPAGDRPREGGEVESWLGSNLARREATPLGDRPDGMTALEKGC